VDSPLAFVLDQLYLITVVVFAVASFVILRRSRREPGSPGRLSLAGVRTAATASVVSGLVVVVVLVAIAWVFRGLSQPGYYYGDGPRPAPPQADPRSLAIGIVYGLFWLVSVPFVAFLAVLDSYAIWPPRLEKQARVSMSHAVLGILFSASLLGMSIFIRLQVDDAIASAAERDAREASGDVAREVEARSTGLSMEVKVVDVELGATTQNGRIVARLTLDVTIRSATAIDLRDTTSGGKDQALELLPAYAPGAGYSPPMYLEWAEVPSHIPAGFEGTYRVDVPVAGTIPAGQMQPDPVTTGEWEARLTLLDRSPGPARVTLNGPVTLWFETSAAFTVSDGPSA